MADLFQQQIRDLRHRLEQYEYEYYVLNAPTISDTEYDHLMKELEALEEEHPEYLDANSPTQRVGSDLVSGDRSVAHMYPMLSLANTYSWLEVVDFYRSIEQAVGGAVEMVSELKFDGVSISVIYIDGILDRAITRGDGTRGDDVTSAVRAIKSVPLKLRGNVPFHYLEVRGEILLPWVEFDRLNAEREKSGDRLFANPRNAVAGTIKQLSPAVVSQRNPTAYFYYLLTDDDSALPRTHHQRLEMMKAMGLVVSSHSTRCKNLQEVKDFIDKWEIDRQHLNVATDGIVIKVDDYDLHHDIGMTAKSPKWAFAYKYPAESAFTRLNSVDFQVGRTGVVTPVANLDSVHLSGTTVKRASLHNADIISSLDLHIGDMVEVMKGGEIIPKITRVREDLRDGTLGDRVSMPQHCPACGTELIKAEDGAGTYCPNENTCPPQIKGRLEHFASRKAMNINIGPETIEDLYQLGLVQNVADLYDLVEEDLLKLPGFKEKSAHNLYESIQASKVVPYSRLMYALGIKEVGETIARLLTSEYPDINSLIATDTSRLEKIDGIGPRIASSIVSFLADTHNLEMIKRLQERGLQFYSDTPNIETKGSQLEGMNIVVSGVFSSISRDALKDLIRAHGGRVASGVTSKTSIMLIGDKVGPSKLEKAKQLGIEVMPEETFFNTYQIRPEDH